ncbi:MAG TPA: ABC transporter permease, partial [Vicinamibacterales bacterium]|nr:ABC transporter permease [Vicinamibacterales bacterium]
MAAWSDLRYSARSLTRAPGFAVALWLTIALGIGANASVRGFIRGSVDRGVPLSDVEGAVSLFARGSGDTFGPVSYDDYLLLKAQLSELELLGAVRELHRHVDIDGRSSIMAVAAVTREVAELLNLSLDDGVVVSDRVRRSELYRKARVHGEPVRIDGIDTRVAGVAPDWLEGLYAGRPVDIWTTLPEESLRDSDRGSRTFWALGRLRPGVSVEEAQAAVSARRSAADAIAVLPYTGIAPEVAGGMARIGRLLPIAAGAVFLIACTNIVAFLLARASARSHETSVRVALGASLWQLGRQLLSDSALITVVGGAVGVLLAYWTAHVIPALFFEQDAERLVFSPDVAGIFAASAACAGITIACGLTPLVETRHDDPAAVLQREGTGVSRAQRRVRSGLAVSQMACCSVLVISTALLLAAFRAALRTGAGDRLGRPILATLQASRGFDRPDLGLTYFRNAEQAVESLPGVSATAWVGTLPGGRPMWSAIRAEPPHLPRREVMLDVALFTPRSLALVHLPPVAGRMFGGADTIHSCRVVVVNEEAARALFDGDAVGRSIEDPAGEHAEIIGVVRTRRRARTDAPSRPTVYYYAEQIG